MNVEKNGNILHKLFYYVGSYIRSPEIFKIYKFLKKSESWSIEQLEEYQSKELIKILRIAYNQSEFYANKIKANGISIDDIKSINDLSKLPIIDKKDLLDNIDKIQIDKGFRKLFYSETSGSTGEPLVWYRDSFWDATTRAAQLRGYSWYEVKPWDRNGYFWGFNYDRTQRNKTKFMDFLLNRFRIFSYSEKKISDFLEKIPKAMYLEGYSSMIYEVAKRINDKHDIKNFNLKMIKGTSEKILDSYQDEIVKAFGKKMISEYGSAETGLIAYECPYGNMHICMENVIVEEIDGEIVATNLVSKSFPIIRYRLGDFIKLDINTKCDCGMKHHIISEVIGRVGKLIYGEKDTYPSLTLYNIFKNLARKSENKLIYQAIQYTPGELTINFSEELTLGIKHNVIMECKKYFKDDIKLNLVGNGIVRNHEEKFKDFISYLD